LPEHVLARLFSPFLSPILANCSACSLSPSERSSRCRDIDILPPFVCPLNRFKIEFAGHSETVPKCVLRILMPTTPSYTGQYSDLDNRCMSKCVLCKHSVRSRAIVRRNSKLLINYQCDYFVTVCLSVI